MGDRRNQYSIRINEQWRICFRFHDGDVFDVEIVDTTDAEPPLLVLPPIHSGEILAEELVDLGLSAEALARALDVPGERIDDILNGRRPVSADTALRLARYFGISAKFWMNLQQSYDLACAEREVGEAIRATVRPRAA